MGADTELRTEPVEVPGTDDLPGSPRGEHEPGELAVEAYARDHEGLTEDDERDALDFLLAPKPPRQYAVPVDYDTESGVRPLKFIITGLDGRRIDAIEQANRSATTGVLDQITADCQIVAEAAVGIEGRPGHRVALDSEEYLTIRRPGKEPVKLASPADALEARFKTQLGLISGVAREVRRISGYDPQRVGIAQRRLVEAAGNS